MDILQWLFVLFAIFVIALNIAYIRGYEPLEPLIEIPRIVLLPASIVGLVGLATMFFDLPAIDAFFSHGLAAPSANSRSD
ncbi:MAG: hypothetical protein DHS20C05_15470 [Hyphococcus sp.]|nr:MAG: hypothetical protein DHS20C05_15470 [Marinicaulis sp.]